MSPATDQEQDFFDPMVGRFRINPAAQLESFFKSKLRWRGDAELAQFAWDNVQQMNPSGANNERQVNMLLTEQMRPQDWACRPDGPSCSSMTMAATASPSGQPRDPSLMDYEAIDVYWRRDIEQEKGMPPATVYDGASSQEAASEQQFEMDLQLLTEKSLFGPLSSEENFLYENLSKAHYTDFYRNVAAAPKEYQVGSSQQYQFDDPLSNSPSSSRAVSDYPRKTSLFETHHESNPEDFFASLAKETFDETPLPPAEALEVFSNVTLCDNQSPLMNNVTLSQAVPVNTTNATSVIQEQLSTDFAAASAYNQTAPSVGLGQEPTTPDFDLNDLDAIIGPLSDLADTVPHPQDAVMQAQTGRVSEWLSNLAPSDQVNGQALTSEHGSASDYDVSSNETDYSAYRSRRSPSSGIGSMTSSSPTSFDESHSRNDGVVPSSRFYNKLAPEPVHEKDHQYYSNTPSNSRRESECKPVITSYSIGGTVQTPRRRGRQSKDEQLAAENALPASAEELAAMTHQEIQRLLRDPKLTNAQKALVKKIRRRGRNKVAARKCRERRVNDRHAPIARSVQSPYYDDDYYEEKFAIKQIEESLLYE
ncbi:Protein SKN-1 c [Aphelenchoides avenae]|nr:Protein SKN-1 c [Aphelenchus avenae]